MRCFRSHSDDWHTVARIYPVFGERLQGEKNRTRNSAPSKLIPCCKSGYTVLARESRPNKRSASHPAGTPFMNARTESTKPSSSPPYSAPDTLCARHSQRECLAPHSILVCIPHNDTTQPITAHHYAASICAGYARPPGVVTGDWFVLEATWAPVRAAGRVRAAVGVHLDPHICHSAPEGVHGTSVKPARTYLAMHTNRCQRTCRTCSLSRAPCAPTVQGLCGHG